MPDINERINKVKRIISIFDITALNDMEKQPKGNQLYEHGGYGQGGGTEELLKDKGYSLVSYNKGLNIRSDDIILFSDRDHFYYGWKLLRMKGILCNTICIMIESGVCDKKCGKKDLHRIRNAFPAFFTYQDDLIDGHRFFKYCPSVNSSTTMECRNTSFESMKLGAIVCTNKNPDWAVAPGELYSERRKIICFFENHKEYSFGLYGSDWDGWSNWKGTVKSKGEIYSQYKFAFCLENLRVNGYITEKIFDCFQKGIVPVYGGAYNVTDYIPSECFIDYFSFDDMQELVNYLNEMKKETYYEYLNNIQIFLKSEKFLYFRLQSQIERICEVIPVLPKAFTPDFQAKVNMFIFIECYEKFMILKRKVLRTIVKLKSNIPILRNMHLTHNS